MSFFKRRKKAKQEPRQQTDHARNVPIVPAKATAQMGNPARFVTAGLPKVIADDVRDCMEIHTAILEKKAQLSHEATYLVERMVSDYLPESIQHYHDALEQGQTETIVDGRHTTAQVCQQNIRMIKMKLQNILEETSSKTQTEMLIQRNFLMEQLDIDATPEVDDAPMLIAPVSKKVTGRGIEDAGKPVFDVGDRVRLDLRRLVDDWGGLHAFQNYWNWKVERDYDTHRSPVGLVKRPSVDDYAYDVQFYFHGLVTNVPSDYLISYPKKKGKKKENRKPVKARAVVKVNDLTTAEDLEKLFAPFDKDVEIVIENTASRDTAEAIRQFRARKAARKATAQYQEVRAAKQRLYSPQQAARKLGIPLRELYRVDHNHTYSSARTPGGHRRYTEQDVERIRHRYK